MEIVLFGSYGKDIVREDQLSFPVNDVLDTSDDIITRKRDLLRAIMFATEDNAPVTIVFETMSGLARTKRRVHEVSESEVILDGINIPLTAIHCVLFASILL